MAIQIASQKKAGMIKIIPAFLFSIVLCLKLYVYLKQLSQTSSNKAKPNYSAAGASS